MAIPIICPSHKRAKRITTHQAIALDGICIPESQVPEYEAENLGVPLIVHPDSIKGLPPKRQWLYEKYGDICMIDDDISSFIRTYTPKYQSRKRYITMSPDEAYDAIQATGETCRNLGAYVFSFAYAPAPVWYRAQQPLKMNMPINGAVLGMLAGSDLFYDNRCVNCEDTYISGLNAFFHRYLFVDTRFAFQQLENFSNPGGLSGMRTHGTDIADKDLLKSLFGDAIVGRGGNRALAGPLKMPGNRSLRIPY